MSNEQQEALTLDALLGLSGEGSSRASGSDAGVLGSASDLLLDLVGSAPASPDPSLSLENLPTLPRIPKASAAGAEAEAPAREVTQQACEQPKEPVREQPAGPVHERPEEPVRERLADAEQPAGPVREAADVEQPASVRETADAARETVGTVREKAPESLAASQPEVGPAVEAKVEISPVPAAKATPKAEAAPPVLVAEAPVPLRESRRMRKGKHANDEAKDRAFCGKHAIRPTVRPASSNPAPAIQPAPQLASAIPPALQPAPQPAPAGGSAPQPAPQPAKTPTPPAAVEPSPSEPEPKAPSTRKSRAADARRAELNNLSKKLESKIIAASERHSLNDQRKATPARDEAKRPVNPQTDLNDAAKESPMFDERPQSIAEGMREGQREHYRFVRIKIACGAAALLLLIALTLGFVASLSLQHGAEKDARDEVETASTAEPSAPARIEDEASVSDKPSESAAKPSEKPAGKSSSGGPASSTEDRSGTVTYRYVAPDESEGDRTVTETVEFGKDGLCEKSLMEVEFASSEAAEAFAADIRRDYGSAALSVEVDGTQVRAEVDTSSNGFDREAYEDALRDSVRDLTILKKS